MRPVSKRAFAFRYIIESLGQKIMVVHQTSLLKTFACPTEKIGCLGRSGIKISRPAIFHMKLEHSLIGMVIQKCVFFNISNTDIIFLLETQPCWHHG